MFINIAENECESCFGHLPDSGNEAEVMKNKKFNIDFYKYIVIQTFFRYVFLIRFIVSFVAETNRKIASEGNDTTEDQPNSDADINISQPIFKKKPSYSNAFILKSEDTIMPNYENHTSGSSSKLNKKRKSVTSDNKVSDNSGI